MRTKHITPISPNMLLKNSNYHAVEQITNNGKTVPVLVAKLTDRRQMRCPSAVSARISETLAGGQTALSRILCRRPAPTTASCS